MSIPIIDILRKIVVSHNDKNRVKNKKYRIQILRVFMNGLKWENNGEYWVFVNNG